MSAAKILLFILAFSGQPISISQDSANLQPFQVETTMPGGVGHYRSGNLRFIYSLSGIDLVLGPEQRHIDRNQLPVYGNDCSHDASECASTRRTFCETCIKYFNAVGWDERRRLFFVIAAGTSRNKPWILAGYDFTSNRVTRFGEFWGGGAGLAVLSPSGRYLAMEGFGVCGGCCTSTYVMVADLVEHRIGTRKETGNPASPDVTRIDKIRWSGEREILFDAVSYKEDDCHSGAEFEKKQSTESLKLSDIAFR